MQQFFPVAELLPAGGCPPSYRGIELNSLHMIEVTLIASLWRMDTLVKEITVKTVFASLYQLGSTLKSKDLF